ncbi:MAG: hypothetical protein Q9168_004771 [Polycauliona sp. 1 TL-2023]
MTDQTQSDPKIPAVEHLQYVRALLKNQYVEILNEVCVSPYSHVKMQKSAAHISAWPTEKSPKILGPPTDKLLTIPGASNLCLAMHELRYCDEMLSEYHKLLTSRCQDMHKLVAQNVRDPLASNLIDTMDKLVAKSSEWKDGLYQMEARLVLDPEYRSGEQSHVRSLINVRKNRLAAIGDHHRTIAAQRVETEGGKYEPTIRELSDDLSVKTSKDRSDDTCA